MNHLSLQSDGAVPRPHPVGGEGEYLFAPEACLQGRNSPRHCGCTSSWGDPMNALSVVMPPRSWHLCDRWRAVTSFQKNPCSKSVLSIVRSACHDWTSQQMKA